MPKRSNLFVRGFSILMKLVYFEIRRKRRVILGKNRVSGKLSQFFSSEEMYECSEVHKALAQL